MWVGILAILAGAHGAHGAADSTSGAAAANAAEVRPFEAAIENVEGLVLIRARLVGPSGVDTTGLLVLDTGAGYLALDDPLAFRLGLTTSTLPDGVIRIAEHPLSRLAFAGLELDQVSPVITVNGEVVWRVIDRPVLGLLGVRPLDDRALALDYESGRLAILAVPPRADEGEDVARRVATSRASLDSASTARAIAVPFVRAGDGKLLIRVRVSRASGAEPLFLALDTGATKSVVFEEPLARRAPDHRRWRSVTGLAAPTLTGDSEARVTRVPRFELMDAVGGLTERDVEMAVLGGSLGAELSRAAGQEVHGLLGYSFLRRFKLVIDFPRSVLWLERLDRPANQRPWEESHIGIQIERRDGDPVITGVVKGSPADRGGVERGDLLVAIDGVQVRELDLVRAAHRLEGRPGSQVSITIARKGREQSLTLVRRRIR